MNSQEIIFFAPLHFTENICQKHAVLGISRWWCHKGHSYLSQVSENRSRFQRGLQLNIFPFFLNSGLFCDRAKQMSVIFPARQKQHIFTHNVHRTMAGTHTETILSRLTLSVKWLKWWLKQINLSLCCSSPYNFWLTSRLAIPQTHVWKLSFVPSKVTAKWVLLKKQAMLVVRGCPDGGLAADLLHLDTNPHRPQTPCSAKWSVTSPDLLF